MTGTSPQPAETPKAWMGAEMAAAPERWTRWWSDEELDDLLAVSSELDPDNLVRLEPAAVAPSATSVHATMANRAVAVEIFICLSP